MEKIVKLWIKYDNVFLSGLVGTLWISAVTVVLGTLLGMLIALMRMGKSKVLNIIADAYIEILRGTPILSPHWWSTAQPIFPKSSAPVSAPLTRASGRLQRALA